MTNHRDDLISISQYLLYVFSTDSVKVDIILNILETLVAYPDDTQITDAMLDDDNFQSLAKLEISLEDLFEGTPEFDAWLDSTDYIKTYAPFFNFNGGVCHG